MPIIRVEKHRHNYVIIDKSGLEDDRLSIRARGLLAILLTKPDDWEINIAYLARSTPKEGREALMNAMHELEQCGYASKTLQRDEDTGQFRGYVTTVYETPFLGPTEVGKTEVGKTEVGKTEVGLAEVGKPATTKELNTTKDPKNQKLKETNTPPSPSARGAVADSFFSAASDKTRHTDSSPTFERWWQTYPPHNRIDKKTCAKTWGTKHLDPRTEEIIAHTAAMKHTKQWQEGKIPNTTTYLNQERYDTPPPEGAASSGTSDALMAQLLEIEREALDKDARDRKAHP